MDYKAENNLFWNRKYFAPNVENFIFRLKPWLLDNYIKKSKKLKVLDYGCGEGSNINFLSKNFNYDVYGVDISHPSIKTCHKKKLSKKKFKVINFDVSENDKFFNTKFDLIISIQVLYYLNNEDMRNRLISLKKMLKPGGYVFFTMMSEKNYYFQHYSNKKKNNEGLTKVNLSRDKNYKKRQNQNTYQHYINFIKNEKDLKNKFKIFKPLNIGYYDGSLKSLNEGGHHFTFFGKNI